MSRSIPPPLKICHAVYHPRFSGIMRDICVCVFSPHLFWAPVYTFRYKWVHYYIYICIYISVYLLFIIVFGAFVGVLYISLYMLVDRKEFFQLLSFYP